MKKEHLCVYEVVSVTKLQEENRVYQDKIRDLERTLAIAKLDLSSNSDSSSSSSSDASSSSSEVGRARTYATMRGI
jgi:hypothetical protein